MSKEWTVNKGRKRAPFAKGTLIDVKYLRHGPRYGVECGGVHASDWELDGMTGDILEYRLHTPETTEEGTK